MEALGLQGIYASIPEVQDEFFEEAGGTDSSEISSFSWAQKLAFPIVIGVVVLLFSIPGYFVFGNMFLSVLFTLLAVLMIGSVTLPYYRFGESDFMELQRRGVRWKINVFAIIMAVGFFYILI